MKAEELEAVREIREMMAHRIGVAVHWHSGHIRILLAHIDKLEADDE